MKKYLVGIDIGTSGTKSVLFDLDGSTVASATREYPMSQPKNGYAEQDPADWWRAVRETLRELARECDGEIVGIGLSGQMHSVVLLDESFEVLRPSILWCDQRTAGECELMERIVGREELVRITGNPAMTGFTAAKLLWVKNNEPEIYSRVKHILLCKDYIRYKLTGELVTDAADGSGMQLLDLKTRKFSPELCEKLGIDMRLLPRVIESHELSGRITAEASAITGIPEGVAVAGGGGDNACAALGVGVYESGRAFTTIGTSGVVFAPTDELAIDPAGRIHTLCSAVPGGWHVMGVALSSGLSLNWFRSSLAPELSYKEIDELAMDIQVGAEKLIYLPYLMGERTPLLDPNARGVFFGLSAMHTRAHLARAVLEGISYSLNDCVELIRDMGIELSSMTLCGGGAKSPLWQQMLSDIYGIPIGIPSSSEGAALGAAILGGCAAGVYPSVGEGCERVASTRGRVTPNAERGREYQKYYEIYKSIYPAVKRQFKELSEL